MAQDSHTLPANQNSPARDHEADRIDRMKQVDTKNREIEEGARGANNPIQIEQDNRVAKAKADAEATGSGPNRPQRGLNQDG